MPKIPFGAIAEKLSLAELEYLLALKRAGPKLQKLEARRGQIAAQLADVEKQIAALTGGETPKTKAQRGRKMGRPAKSAKTPGKQGRKPGRKPAAKAAPAKRATKTNGRPVQSAPVRRPAPKKAASCGRRSKSAAGGVAVEKCGTPPILP